MQRIHNNRPRRRGAAMVEMALVLPIFVMVTLGIIEFGRAMMVAQLITNAAREGARLAIIDGNSNTIVRTSIQDFLKEAVGVSAADVGITITIVPANGNPDPGGEVANANARDLITIRVEVPYEKVNYIRAKWLVGKKIVGSVAMRHE